MLERLKHLVPVAIRVTIRPKLQAIRYPVADALNFLRRGDRNLLPPFVGEGDFEQIGNEFLSHFQSFGLEAHHRVLDVGSGIGRMALPLTRFLTGEYRGFDIVKQEVRWCQNHITPKFPHFEFTFADIYNSYYNPNGVIPAAEYRFPYPPEFFDFAFATSVFTHLRPDAMLNYLSEMVRVIKPSGRLLVTWFILNDEARRLIRAGRSSVDLTYEEDGFMTASPSRAEFAIGFEEETVRGEYRRRGLECRIHYGSWCGREEALSYQDIVVSSPSSGTVEG